MHKIVQQFRVSHLWGSPIPFPWMEASGMTRYSHKTGITQQGRCLRYALFKFVSPGLFPYSGHPVGCWPRFHLTETYQKLPVAIVLREFAREYGITRQMHSASRFE